MKKVKFTVSFEVEIGFDDEIDPREAVNEITESMYFPCEDTYNVSIVEQRRAQDIEWEELLPKYKAGDEVFWNDPDGGKCSGIHKVISVNTDDIYTEAIYTLSFDGGITEVFESELS